MKDYNSNSTNLDSEDEEDPRTPASVSSQVMIDCFAMENQTTTRVLIPDVINHVWEIVWSIIAENISWLQLQGSQGYSSTESDFVDMDSFQTMQTDTSSLPELNLQVGVS